LVSAWRRFRARGRGAALEGDRLGADAEDRSFLPAAAVFPLLIVELAIDEDPGSLLQAVGAVLGLPAPVSTIV
jgi:Mn2+/Fe2+ NRAMP family transporter